MKRFLRRYTRQLHLYVIFLCLFILSLTSVPMLAHAYTCDPNAHPAEVNQAKGQCCDSGQLLIGGQCCPVQQETISGGTISCSGTNSQSCTGGVSQDAATTCLFTKYINPAVQLLSAAVGVVVVIAIIYGGIEYTTSAGDPARVASGKKHIISALIGLLAFLLLYAFLQFLLPGGILNA